MSDSYSDEDGWGTEGAGDNEYSPANFYTKSVDMNGHGTPFRVKIPDHWVPMLMSIKEDVPSYKSIPDIMRDALYHRYKWLKDNMDRVRSTPETQMFESIDKAEQMASRTLILNEMPGKIKKVCEALRDAGDRATLHTYLCDQTATAKRFPEPWRGKVLAVLDNYRGQWQERYD